MNIVNFDKVTDDTELKTCVGFLNNVEFYK